MKFTCEKNELYEACLIASRAVPSKSPMPSLEGLKLEISEKLTITGYDLKKAIYTTVEIFNAEEGSMLVNARFFSEMLRRMPDGKISVSCNEKNNINVKCGKSEYNFSGLNIDEYPEMPVFDELKSLEIPQDVLKNMIQKTLFAVSKEEIRPIYTGSLFEIINEELTLVSVDGYRLARRIEKIKSSKLEDCSFVVPGFTLSDVEKICSDTEDTLSILIGEKHISFKIGETVIISRRLEGEFLNHRKSVPENFRHILKVNRQEFVSVIERVALMLSDSNTNPIRITFDDGNINCYSSSVKGKAEDTCVCEGTGDGLEIGFNDRYLLEALKAAETDEIAVCINTASSPCIIKASDESDNFTYMILPVRIRTN